ncbi:MAG: hypothetical protein ABGZ35_16520, partial [Planctomycetaceae bacterium]
RVSHLSRLISSLGIGNWRFSAPNMSFLLTPWHILFASICGLANQRQQQIIAFQNAQIAALLKKLGRKRLLLDDQQRRLLAVKGQVIGRKALFENKGDTPFVVPPLLCLCCEKTKRCQLDSLLYRSGHASTHLNTQTGTDLGKEHMTPTKGTPARMMTTFGKWGRR